MLRPTVIQVTPQKEYFLDIIFNNGEKRRFDVRPYIRGEWYGELGEPDYFRQVKTDGFTVVWPHGQDICPDELYDLSTEI